MNRKRNVSYIKPEDPEFLTILKKQAGYDDKNHKFDVLQNADEDFAEDDDSEKPQVVVLKKGDLTAEEAQIEQNKIDKHESETKADLTQRVVFKTKHKVVPDKNKSTKNKKKKSNNSNLLSFGDDEGESSN